MDRGEIARNDNSMIDFKISLHGAELQSLRLDGREYLWHGFARDTEFVFDGERSKRYLNHRLAPGEKFKFTYWIEIA